MPVLNGLSHTSQGPFFILEYVKHIVRNFFMFLLGKAISSLTSDSDFMNGFSLLKCCTFTFLHMPSNFSLSGGQCPFYVADCLVFVVFL